LFHLPKGLDLRDRFIVNMYLKGWCVEWWSWVVEACRVFATSKRVEGDVKSIEDRVEVDMQPVSRRLEMMIVVSLRCQVPMNKPYS
jgi:hypothetical protein